jgi:hypothetical protein
MCNTAYKKQGALDRRSTHLLLLLARASLHIKSKGLHRYVIQIDYFIIQNTSRIQLQLLSIYKKFIKHAKSYEDTKS